MTPLVCTLISVLSSWHRPWNDSLTDNKHQRLTYGVVSEGLFAESLRKFAKNTCYCVRKGCGYSAESWRKFRGNLRKNVCNDPFPNDPISALLKTGNTAKTQCCLSNISTHAHTDWRLPGSSQGRGSRIWVDAQVRSHHHVVTSVVIVLRSWQRVIDFSNQGTPVQTTVRVHHFIS